MSKNLKNLVPKVLIKLFNPRKFSQTTLIVVCINILL